MNQELVSIVIPAYNEAPLIGKCLESLKNQTYTGPKEIIICDNNSTDNTGAIARAAGVTVVFEANAGVIPARETGTKAATGTIIIQTDADTTFPPTWLEQIMNAFASDDKVIAVSGSFKFDGGPWWGKYFTALLFGLSGIVNRLFNRLVYIPGANTAFRRSVFKGYDMNLDQGGDEVALLRELRKQGKIVCLPKNYVLTSPRRLSKGLLYNIFITGIYYYCFDYFYRRITGKSLHAYPRIREHKN